MAAGVGGADSDVDLCLRLAMAGGSDDPALTPGFLRLSLEIQTPTGYKHVINRCLTNEGITIRECH